MSYAIIDRRSTLGAMNSPKHQQQVWNSVTMLNQRQDTDMNYVAPTSTSTLPQYHQHHIIPTQQPRQQPSKHQMNRAVIPSKRAAQNRAAQKAFRQRRDQYVKNLEKKSKEMEQWHQKMNEINNENKQLKSMVHQLQQRIYSLTSRQMQEELAVSPSSLSLEAVPEDTRALEISAHSPNSPSMPTSFTSSPGPLQSSSSSPTASPVTNTHHPLKHSFSSSLSSVPSPHQQQQHSYHSGLPISLRPHSFLPSTNDPPLVPSSSIPFVPRSSHPPTSGHTPLFELHHLDPFFDKDLGFAPGMDEQLDFVGNTSGGQVLDDLFAMLQTRQRPQIPLRPPQNQYDDQPPLSHYDMMDHVTSSETLAPLV
ncbi:hypothetical protein BCR42DRAFT_488016 [Absidia repens]|uniref:BZIP domain-containing protein n=1 Tax=Absidia repens TaxID=90262 RepID=A0A1X2IUK5_9FUNG|nr:hypothetical protein BCR42DRAFT_488016 [Absidia repens]